MGIPNSSDKPSTPYPCKLVVLLGAESTGKSTLAVALVDALNSTSRLKTAPLEASKLGRPKLQPPDKTPEKIRQAPCAVLISEYLRTFCTLQGRTPHLAEQGHIAQIQNAQIEAALATPDVQWVVADTCSLVTAVYSEHVFDDRSLYNQARAWLTGQHAAGSLHVLLMGLDLPWVADGQRDGAHAQAPVDALLRAALAEVGVPFQTVYGSGPARLQQALHALNVTQAGGLATVSDREANLANSLPAATESTRALMPQRRLRARCDECLSPECEHALFTGLGGLS